MVGVKPAAPGILDFCRNCKGKVWSVALSSPRGSLYLCRECAEEAILQRDSNSGSWQRLQERCRPSTLKKE